MDGATTPEGRVRAWIEGVLAQASRPEAASRTRPFFADKDRLAAAFPEEHQRSLDRLLDLLGDALPGGGTAAARRRDAVVIYHAAFGLLDAALQRGTAVTAAESTHLVAFCLRGLGAG
jgi:hypothetical protein